MDDAARAVTAGRPEFLGRNGTLRSPAAMTCSRLSGKVGDALDPCAAVQVPFELVEGQEREFLSDRFFVRQSAPLSSHQKM
ncbi:MAG: hypothetical protein HY644_05940 [Acidobacteria bacterium]|nr:hypothetical protein [Acidobacteriota bacterium]